MALDSVQVDARRRSAETSELMQRSCRDLRRALVKYVRAERCRLELAGICAAAADDDAVASPGGFAATAAEAWEAAQILLQRAEALAGDWWGQADDEAVRVAPSSHEDEHFGDRRDFTASNLAKGQCCADCGDQDAEWASVSYGIFLCTECAGRHRGLGVHRSFVRSATMDKWTARQLRCMKLGGNSRFTEFMSTYPRLVGAGPLSQGELELRYSSQAAAFYRSRLEAECDGREPSHPPPPPLVGHQPDDGAGPASPPMPSSDGHRATEDWSADDEDSGSLEVERERLVEAYAEWCRRVSAPALGPGPGEGKDEY